MPATIADLLKEIEAGPKVPAYGGLSEEAEAPESVHAPSEKTKILQDSPISTSERLIWGIPKTNKGRVSVLKKLGFSDDQILTPDDPNNPFKDWAIYDPLDDHIAPIDPKGLNLRELPSDIAESAGRIVPVVTSGIGASMAGTAAAPTGPGVIPATALGGAAGYEAGSAGIIGLAKMLGLDEEYDPKRELIESGIAGVTSLLPGSSNILKGAPGKWIETLAGKTAAKGVVTGAAEKAEPTIEQLAKLAPTERAIAERKMIPEVAKLPIETENTAVGKFLIGRKVESPTIGRVLSKKGYLAEEGLPIGIENQAPQILGEAGEVARNFIDNGKAVAGETFGQDLVKAGITDAYKLSVKDARVAMKATVDAQEKKILTEDMKKAVGYVKEAMTKMKDNMVVSDLRAIKENLWELADDFVDDMGKNTKASVLLKQAYHTIMDSEKKVPALAGANKGYASRLEAISSFRRATRAQKLLGEDRLERVFTRLALEKGSTHQNAMIDAVDDFIKNDPAFAKAFTEAGKKSGQKLSFIDKIKYAQDIYNLVKGGVTKETGFNPMNIPGMISHLGGVNTPINRARAYLGGTKMGFIKPETANLPVSRGIFKGKIESLANMFGMPGVKIPEPLRKAALPTMYQAGRAETMKATGLLNEMPPQIRRKPGIKRLADDFMVYRQKMEAR